MPSGRSVRLQRLYELELGQCLPMQPVDGESIEVVHSRLKQVVTKWLREGKAYRLERKSDHVLATRVEPGSNHKLSRYTDLRLGERVFEGADLSLKERKSLMARIERLGRLNSGLYMTEVCSDGIYVRCVVEPNGREYWYNNAATLPPKVDLRQS